MGNPKDTAQLLMAKPVIASAWQNLIQNDSTNTDEIEHDMNHLLKEILELYITVRFFAFTNKSMEHYKKKTKAHVQKSKSLRSKLNAEP